MSRLTEDKELDLVSIDSRREKWNVESRNFYVPIIIRPCHHNFKSKSLKFNRLQLEEFSDYGINKLAYKKIYTNGKMADFMFDESIVPKKEKDNYTHLVVVCDGIPYIWGIEKIDLPKNLSNDGISLYYQWSESNDQTEPYGNFWFRDAKISDEYYLVAKVYSAVDDSAAVTAKMVYAKDGVYGITFENSTTETETYQLFSIERKFTSFWEMETWGDSSDLYYTKIEGDDVAIYYDGKRLSIDLRNGSLKEKKIKKE
jgi:hypothetical protein